MCSNSLDNSVLEWAIDNFSLCLTNDAFTFKSPDFELRRSRTKWFLELSIDGSSEKTVKMVVLLCRNSEDDDADDVYLRFAFSLRSADGTFTWQGSELVSVFTKVTRCGDHLEKNFSSCELLSTRDIDMDTMIVTCKMMLVYDVLPVEIDPDADALCRDLLDMWDSGKQGNAVLIAGGQEIRIYKEVLSARSEVFAKLLRSCESRIVSPFCAEAMFILLAYVYSDKLPNLAPERPPPFELYDCAKHYEIYGLKEDLEPRTMDARSSVRVERYGGSGLIPNFTLADSRPFCSFPRMFNGTLFQFTVSRAALQEILVVSVQLWNTSEELMSLSLGLDLQNTANGRHDHRTALMHPDSSNYCCHTVVVPEENLYGGSRAFHQGDLLIVNFELRIRFKASTQIDSSADCRSVSDFRIPCIQRSLRFQMMQLWTSSTFADARITSGGRDFKVHQAIVGARSPVLKREFEDSNFIASDLAAAVLDHLLFYIYTGLVISTDPLRLMDLHSAALQYKVSRLPDTCASLLKVAPLTIKNVSAICLFAKRSRLPDLKQKCIDFIVENSDLVFDKPGWALLKSEDAGLGSEILLALGSKT